VGLLMCTVSLLGCGSLGAGATPAPDPIITRVADPNIPWPAAAITGRLSLKKGCLMIGSGVAVWPAETSWDADKLEVVFGGDLAGAPNAPVGSIFKGSGGLLRDDMSGVLSKEAEAAVRACLTKTGATYATLAAPQVPWPKAHRPAP